PATALGDGTCPLGVQPRTGPPGPDRWLRPGSYAPVQQPTANSDAAAINGNCAVARGTPAMSSTRRSWTGACVVTSPPRGHFRTGREPRDLYRRVTRVGDYQGLHK